MTQQESACHHGLNFTSQPSRERLILDVVFRYTAISAALTSPPTLKKAQSNYSGVHAGWKRFWTAVAG